ncbi:putative Transmembrane protein [Quillaja saponaria]|uniref:Transmembrane protein n=1 Tax=Quillaja saponaria TaxID=32244 RepID=A0AAD7KXU9_QUISA|nr:putative Transmembrane protein [Quillaja saponaria]
MANSNLNTSGAIGGHGNMRCHHCAGPLSKEMETSDWTVAPLVRDSFSMIGSAVGGTTSAFYGFNHVMPIIQRRVKGPMWLHFLIGAPPVIVFSSACAGLAGGAVPALSQLVSSSYHAALSSPSLPPPASKDDKMHKSRTSSTL